MKENDFITWFSAQTLNLQGYVLIVKDKKISKDNYSSVSIDCTFENGIWRIIKKGPEDKTCGSSELLFESREEDQIFEDLKKYLEDMDYINNYYSK